MNDVIVEDKHQSPGRPISAPESLQQLDERRGTLRWMFGPVHSPGIDIQRPHQAMFDVLTRGKDTGLVTSARPDRTESGGSNPRRPHRRRTPRCRTGVFSESGE